MVEVKRLAVLGAQALKSIAISFHPSYFARLYVRLVFHDLDCCVRLGLSAAIVDGSRGSFSIYSDFDTSAELADAIKKGIDHHHEVTP